MKLSTVISSVALVGLLVSGASAQNSANQTVNLTVSPISRLAIAGSPISLTVSNPVSVGSDALASVTDNSTSYSLTHNSATALRITAALDQALPAGYTLDIALSPSAGKGTGAGTVDISNATAASAVNVVTGIPRGADASRAITYTFSALASAGALASTQRTVTLTLTN
jgi:hypothetical protein